MLFHGIDNLLSPLSNLVLILPLQHHAQQRLGAGVAHEQPAAAFEARLDGLHHGGHGGRFLAFVTFLTHLRNQHGAIHAVYYEDVKQHAGTLAAHAYGGFLASLQIWCHTNSRIPLYPLPPVLFLALVTVLIALLATGRPKESLLGLAIVLSGLPVYRVVFRQRRSEFP